MNNSLENEIRFWESMYFKNENSDEIPNKIEGLSITNQTEEELEKNFLTNHRNGKIDMEIVAWKFGKLEKQNKINYTYKDGTKFLSDNYGNKISVDELNNYIKWINTNVNVINNEIEAGDLEGAFEMLAREEKPVYVPKKFGTVYIITLMSFISKGKIPIYDRFAHTAVKAIFANKFPYEIYVGEAPSKKKPKKAINMLNEYRWLIQKTFHVDTVSPELDRALWVYGHATEKCTTKWKKADSE